MHLVEPNFSIETNGYTYLGRGPDATGEESGWQRHDDLYFRCAECGDMIQSTTNENYECQCGSMHIDADYHRFGSNHSDINILVYSK